MIFVGPTHSLLQRTVIPPASRPIRVKVIVNRRNAQEHDALRALGADVVLPFDLRQENARGVVDFELPLPAAFGDELDVVVD